MDREGWNSWAVGLNGSRPLPHHERSLMTTVALPDTSALSSGEEGNDMRRGYKATILEVHFVCLCLCGARVEQKLTMGFYGDSRHELERRGVQPLRGLLR